MVPDSKKVQSASCNGEKHPYSNDTPFVTGMHLEIYNKDPKLETDILSFGSSKHFGRMPVDSNIRYVQPSTPLLLKRFFPSQQAD